MAGRAGNLLRAALGVVAIFGAVTGGVGWAAVRAGTQRSETLSALPLPAQAAISATLGRDHARYHARADGHGGFRFENRVHGFMARLTPAGVQVEGRAGRWGLALEGWGYGKGQAPAGRGRPHGGSNRVEYRRGALTEWYVNGPVGLEQGFTLAAPPGGASIGPLTLELALAGGLVAAIDDGARGLTLRSSKGEAVLRYRGLSAADASGRELSAWLELDGQRLRLRVDDAGASYPLTIDPFVQAAKLTASDGAANDNFGNSVAISGDTVVVGAYQDDIGANTNQGSAYVFVKPGGGWATMTQTAKLTASDAAPGEAEAFGNSVAISGDTVVVGAYGDDIGVANRGSAYVFVKPGGGWATMTETAKLTASDGGTFHQFGNSVAISGDTVVVGTLAERAYVFVKPGGGWATMTQTAKLTASDGAGGDNFGNSVAISGDTVVVGAYADDIGATTDQGSAYVFVKPGGGWATMTQTAKLTASDGAAIDAFGFSVAISGDTAVVGAYLDDHGLANQGSAYVFVKPGGGWATMTETAKLTTSDAGDSDVFGISVAISGDTVVVGASGDDVGANQNQGSAYVFVKPGGGWATMTETAKLTASDGAAADQFGYSVAISGDTVVVGAYTDDIGANTDQGSAYVFLSAVCGNGVIEGSEQCDDGNTVGGDCCSATCQYEAAGSSCSDGVFCNGTDQCNATGGCTVHLGNPCPGHNVGPNCNDSCNEAANNCTANDAGGTSCDDGFFCTATDTCNGSGTCVGTGNPCSGHNMGPNCNDSCNEAANNCTANDVSGTSCNDGLFCTATDTCNGSGTCVGTGNPCSGHNTGPNCNDSCNEAANNCTANDVSGTSCNDGLFCTATDTCNGSGTCAGTGNPCSGHNTGPNCNDSCNEAANNCTANDASGTSCADGFFCTATDACNGSGTCVGTGNPCSGHNTGPNCNDSCNEAANNCTANDASGTSCADGFFCTVTDTCNGSGTCVGTGNPCSGHNTGPNCNDSCNEAANNCTANDASGTSCSDGLFCTATDTCNGSGTCVGTGNPCSGHNTGPNCNDSCNEAANNCTANDASGTSCDDGFFCTATDTCNGSGTCVGTGNPCSGHNTGPNCNDSCNEAANNCTANDASDTSCNDGLFCTLTDTCNGSGTCVGTGNPCPGPDGDANCAESCAEPNSCTALDPNGSPCPGGTCVAGLCMLATTTSTTTLSTTTSLLTSTTITVTTITVTTITVTTTTTVTTSTTLPACAPSPMADCQAAAAQTSQIVLRQTSNGPQLRWKWTSSGSVTAADFGSPTTTSDYLFCLYDAAGLQLGALAPADETCRSRPCWKQTSTGFKYTDKELTPDGLQKILLKAGAPGKLLVKGKGPNLDSPTLPFTTPVRAQLKRADASTCWEATYSVPTVTSSTQFSAKSD